MLKERLREARIARDYNQTELDNRAKVAIGTVCAVESGRRENLTLDRVHRLADALGVAPSWLLGGDVGGPGEHAEP
jgi:transcriptional regulator with XRE-family HTH domain